MRAAPLLLALLAGCASAPPASDLFHPREGAPVPQRQLQDVPAEQMQAAVIGVLQDLGFQLAASDPAVGVVIGRRGEPGDYGSRFGRYMGQGMKNFFTLQWQVEPQPDRYVGPVGLSAAVMITPLPSATAVRLSLHRFVEKPGGERILVWAEEVPGPQAHERFFDLLAKALASSAASGPAPARR